MKKLITLILIAASMYYFIGTVLYDAVEAANEKQQERIQLILNR